MDSSLIAAARARVEAHGRCSPVMQEMGAVLDALAIATASAEAYRVDRDLLQRQVRAQDARIAALRNDLRSR